MDNDCIRGEQSNFAITSDTVLHNADSLKTSKDLKEFPNLQDEGFLQVVEKRVLVPKLMGGIHMCDQCGEDFGRKKQLIRHMKTHLDSSPYVCCICSMTFDCQSTLHSHLRTHVEEQSYLSPDCGKLYGDLTLLMEHQKGLVEDKPERGVESPGAGTEINLTVHKVSRGGPFPCPVCGEKFTMPRFLKLHERIHIKPSSVQSVKPKKTCYLCGNEYLKLTPHLLQKHGVRKEKTDSEVSYICLQCGKRFSSQYDLKHHLSTHSGSTNLENGALRDIFAASKHDLPTTSGEDDLQCDTLGDDLTALKHHLSAFTGKNDLQCDALGNSLSTSKYLSPQSGKNDLHCSASSDSLPACGALMTGDGSIEVPAPAKTHESERVPGTAGKKKKPKSKEGMDSSFMAISLLPEHCNKCGVNFRVEAVEFCAQDPTTPYRHWCKAEKKLSVESGSKFRACRLASVEVKLDGTPVFPAVKSKKI